MSTPAQSGVSPRTTVTSRADSLSQQSVNEEDLHRFEREFNNSRDDDHVPHQPMADLSAQLELDLMRFRNGEIEASELEASLIRFKQALQDAGVGASGYLNDGQFMLTEYPIGFSDLPEAAQKSYVQGFLDRYDPVQIYGKRLETVLADFRAERASGQDLERALIDFEENLTAAGVGTVGSVRDGEYLVHDSMASLENFAHDVAKPFLDILGVDTGHVAEVVNTPFSWLQREQQMNVADNVLNDYHYNSPEAQRLEKYELAASIVLPDSPEAANELAQQSARVMELCESLLPFVSSDTSTPANTELLVRELTELVRLWSEEGTRLSRLSYNAGDNTVRRTYNSANPPPWMTQNEIYNLNEEYKNNWTRSRSISALEPDDLLQIARGVANLLPAKVRGLTLDHTDVFGKIPPSSQMRQLLGELNAAQNVPDNVDLDLFYTANIAAAQLNQGQGDLKGYEYRLTDAARALLGDSGWSLHRDTLFRAYYWITTDVELPRQSTTGNSDNDLIPRPPEDVPFTNAWNGTSRETRIEYLGFDVETWNLVEPLLAEATRAHEQRKDGELTVNDVVGMGMGMFIGVASGGTLGPAVAGWLGGSALAGVAGAAVGGAVGSMFSTLIISGDWVTARESFKEVFEGDLKEGLAELALKYIGVDTRYAALVNSATSDEAIDQLTEELGLELVQQFGAPVIDGLKSYTPDIVDSYLDDLKHILLTVDDPEVIAEHAIGWWGGELASMLGVTNESGIKLVTSLLDTAVTSGDFDIGALQEFLGQEVVDYLADVPAEIVERLGGKDSTLALLGGVAAQLVVNNLDNAIEGESFSDNLIEDARAEFTEFVTELAENWVDQGGIEQALSWIPGSENWGTDFRDMIMEGHASGWDGDTLRAHLSESSLFSNLVNSYVPGGGLQNFLTRAIQYASENGLDTQTILNAATIDMVDILANAGISQDVVNFLGGNSAMLAKMSDVFGERLIENGGDLNATLRDMEKYARGLAAGHIGDFTQSMLTQVLGPKAGQVIDAIAGLAEGEAAGWSNEVKEKYIDEQILTPLGDSAAAVVIGAFGGKQNFVAGLLGAMADAYVTNEGDSAAARGAAIDFIMNRLAGLVGGNDQQAEGQPTLVGPQPFSLAESVTQLLQFADENDWDENAIESYVENQFLKNGLAGNLIDTLLGGFGTRAQLSAVLVEELITSWNQTQDPEAVIERFVTFILNPPEVANADSLSNDKVPGAAASLDNVTQDSNFGIESGTMDAATASDLDLNPPALTDTNGGGANDRIYGTDADGNIVDLSDFTISPGRVADAGSVLNPGDSETMTDFGSNRQLASYPSAMQAIVNAEGLTLEQRYDYMVDTTRFYLTKWADDHQNAIANSRSHDQLYWLEESNLDPYLSRAGALLGRVGHNIYQTIPDIQSIFTDPDFRKEAGKSLYQFISDPISTVSSTLDAAGELPLDQQIELGFEIFLTGFVSGFAPKVGYNAAGATGNIAREVVDAIDGSAIALTLRGGILVTDDAVYVARASRDVSASIGVPTSAGEVFRIPRLSAERNAEIDTSTFINPLNNEVTDRGNYKMSIDHILPVDVIVYQDRFYDLTIEQMTNLIQDKNGDLDNLLALPLPMNQSKGNRDALEWAQIGYKGGDLDRDYVAWLDARQEEVLLRVNALIQKYLNED